jgi:hypothetical protein
MKPKAIFWLAALAPAATLAAPDSVRVDATRALPLAFEPNRGQASPAVRYLARTPGAILAFTERELLLVTAHPGARAHNVVRVSWEDHGQTRPCVYEPLEPLMARSNYYLGPRPEAWVRDVPNYEKLVCRGSLGAAELWFYGNQGRLEFDFMMARGWSGGALRLRIRGAERVDLDRAGDLLLKVPGGELRLLRPVVYQGSDRLPPSAARYRIEGPERIALTVSGHDRQKPLRIDPVLTYSTYLGGSGLDGAAAVVTDATGNAYVVGWTSSLNFPVGGGPQPTPGGLMDAFITKLDPTGTTRLYSTYLGGFGNDYALAATLDPAGNLWVAGGTASANFPTASPLQSYAGSTDAFVAKLNPSGTLLFSTYLGGSGFDEAHGIAADASGAYVVGVTQSENFPVTSGAFQTSRRGPADAFVAKYHINASSRIYSTYLGGSASDEANAVGVDAAGNAWIGGTTWSGDFPLAAPLRGHAGASDGFVSKLNATGGALLFSSLLGGTGIDQIFGLGLDPTGNAYVTGSTGSFDFPTTPGAFQASRVGSFPDEDAFVAKFAADGSQMVYSTYLGGSQDDRGMAVVADSFGSAYVTGQTYSSNFPVNDNLRDYGGSADVFVTKLSPSGSTTSFSTFLGGNGNEVGRGIALGSGSRVHVAGMTNSANFPVRPTTGALQASHAGGIEDAFVALVTLGQPPQRLVWMNDTTRQVTVHYFESGSFVGWDWLNASGIPGWQVRGAADFDGNGTPDLVWQNDTTRQATVHYFQGPTFIGWNWLNAGMNPGWWIVAVGDFNADGKPDLLWQHESTRAVTVHYYGGPQGNQFQGWSWLSGGYGGWRVSGAADFDGNGTADLVWQHESTRQVTVHYYAGASMIGWSWLAGGYAGWSVVGVTDFNADGKPDLIWQNDTTRQVTVHYYGGVQGNQFQGWSWLHATGIPGWRAIAPR